MKSPGLPAQHALTPAGPPADALSVISKRPVREIAAEEFAARCLELIDEVAETGEELTVRHNARSVVIVPAPSLNRPSLREMVTFMGDVESPIGDEWEAERDAKA